MSNRTTIWFRDALVITFSIYIVFSISAVSWDNLKIVDSEPDTCKTGCPPLLNFPDDGYYHYTNSIVFDWDPVSVNYRVSVTDDDSGELVFDGNFTNSETATTGRLPTGTYFVRVYYTGISGATFDTYPILKSELVDVVKESGEKLTIVWSEVTVSYTIEIKLHSESDGNLNLAIVHEKSNLDNTEYTYSDFTNGRTYSWSVYAQDSKGYDSLASPMREVNIDTTKFLAFEVFNNWEVPFLLLGVMMVIALQAGVFLAREERDD